MSHITIIIGSSGGSGGNLTTGRGEDAVQITYTPPDDMKPMQIGQEVAKRIIWLSTLPHADAADT